ncbi:hypothetical protein [Limnothrix redekei]|uniref:Uncharacterized protein n=1 Tax=Limnothrix redekei LRLZ20PSL1 TaxID=3112953 RepID=A0ABW7C773_9CYAN
MPFAQSSRAAGFHPEGASNILEMAGETIAPGEQQRFGIEKTP